MCSRSVFLSTDDVHDTLKEQYHDAIYHDNDEYCHIARPYDMHSPDFRTFFRVVGVSPN